MPPAIRIPEPPAQQPDTSPFSSLDPFPRRPQASAAQDIQAPSQQPMEDFVDYGGPLSQQPGVSTALSQGPPSQQSTVATESHQPPAYWSSNEKSIQHLSIPQVHELAKPQYDRAERQEGPPVVESDRSRELSSSNLIEAIASRLGPKNQNPDYLPPVFCCPRLRAPTPFSTAGDIKDRFDDNKTRIMEAIRASDWQIVAFRAQGNNLEAMIRDFWKRGRWSPNSPTDEGLKRLEKELEDLRKDFSSAREQHGHYSWELRDNERSRVHHTQGHEDHEPHFRHFLKWASSSVPEKWGKGPYKYIIQVTEDLTFHEKEFYMIATEELERQEVEEDERRKIEGRYRTETETGEYEAMTKRRAEEMQRLKLKWKKAELRTRLYAPLPNGSYCELECGSDRKTLRPQRIQLGNKLDCIWHHRRYFISLYVPDVPVLDKEGKKLPVAIGGMIFFEEGLGVRHNAIRFWLGRKGWATDLDGDTFTQLSGINDLRAAASRALGISH